MARFQNTFEFIGNLGFGKEVVKETVFESGWARKQANIVINESSTNGAFVTLEGGYNKDNGKSNTIFTFSKNSFGEKGSKIEVAWADRKESFIRDTVADFKKVVVDLTVDPEAKDAYFKLRNEIYNLETKTENVTSEDRLKVKELYKKVRETVPHRYEFIHPLDAVEFFGTVAEKVKGKKFRVKGEVTISHWKEKFYVHYVPTLFELVPDETENKLSAQLDLYFTKHAADKSMFEENKIINYNMYIQSYDSGHKAEKFFPIRTVFNGNKYDTESSKYEARLRFVEKYTSVSGKYVHHIPFEVEVYRGAEEVQVSMDTLTPEQREFVEAGIAEVEDFQTKGSTFGASVNEIRLSLPLLKDFGEGNDFTRGVVETTFTDEDLIYYPADTKGAKTNKPSSESEGKKSPEIDLDDLPF